MKNILLQRYQTLKQQKTNIRALDAAQQLGVSEAELVASRVESGVTRLIDDPVSIFEQLELLGKVMSLTRNPDCVIERKGTYLNWQLEQHGKMRVGLFVGADIDLRMFLNHWKYCFAVTEYSGKERVERKSIQFFNGNGLALHKIYMLEDSNMQQYQQLIETFKHREQSHIITVEAKEDKPSKVYLPTSEVDWEAFRKQWLALQDVHDFFPMLHKYKVGRVQAMENVGSDLAYKVPVDSARKVLEALAETKTGMMIFVGNKGCIGIHSGPIEKLKAIPNWFNILDDMLHFHLRETAIDQIWVTKKPSVDGTITSFEIYDTSENLIATFYGQRKPGNPELTAWRDIIAKLPKMAS